MTQQVTFFPLTGGLDMVAPAITASAGAARTALNYEAEGAGYKRMSGYERFDGRLSPTKAFELAATVEQGAIDRENARTAILPVPGSGPVRGVWFFKDRTYAFRDNATATECVMHIATSSGWTAVALSLQLAFTSGGTYAVKEGDTITGETSGATAVVQRVIRTSGSFAAGDAAGYYVLASQTGTFAAENIKVGANLDVATISGNSAAATLPAGGRYEFVNHNFYGASQLQRMYGVNGVGKAFEFDGATFVPITTGMAVDTPTRIAVHRKHLFLAFPGGSLQHSATGEPTSWTPLLGAGELAIGDEITDLLPATQANLAILGRNSVSILYGNDSADWQMETLSDEAGALPWTADKVGQAIYMDNRGIRSLAATQAYGNFSIGTLTRRVAPLIESKMRTGVKPVSSVRVRAKDTYRVFFEDGSGLSIYMGKKEPEIMAINLSVGDVAMVVRCIVSAETSDNEEVIYFGSDDGYVYQMDRGRSFDGKALTYYVRLNFTHLGSPQVLKVWRKAVLECVAGPETTLRITGEVDYGDPDQPSVGGEDVSVRGGGGFWGDIYWDQFYWSNPAEGTAVAHLDAAGKNMSLLIGGEEADEDPHLLQGLTLFYTVRGLQR